MQASTRASESCAFDRGALQASQHRCDKVPAQQFRHVQLAVLRVWIFPVSHCCFN